MAGHRELGDTLKSKGDFAGAELAYAEARRLEDVYEDEELTEEELRGRIAESLDDGSLHQRLGDLLLDNGDARGAEVAYREGTKKAPKHPLHSIKRERVVDYCLFFRDRWNRCTRTTSRERGNSTISWCSGTSFSTTYFSSKTVEA